MPNEEIKVMELKFTLNKETGNYEITFYYTDGSTFKMVIGLLPKGIILNRHYSITDLYGYGVIDDREGL